MLFQLFLMAIGKKVRFFVSFIFMFFVISALLQFLFRQKLVLFFWNIFVWNWYKLFFSFKLKKKDLLKPNRLLETNTSCSDLREGEGGALLGWRFSASTKSGSRRPTRMGHAQIEKMELPFCFWVF